MVTDKSSVPYHSTRAEVQNQDVVVDAYRRSDTDDEARSIDESNRDFRWSVRKCLAKDDPESGETRAESLSGWSDLQTYESAR